MKVFGRCRVPPKDRSVAYAARRLPADVFLPIQPFIRGVSRRLNQRTFHAKACFATFMKPSFTSARWSEVTERAHPFLFGPHQRDGMLPFDFRRGAPDARQVFHSSTRSGICLQTYTRARVEEWKT